MLNWGCRQFWPGDVWAGMCSHYLTSSVLQSSSSLQPTYWHPFGQPYTLQGMWCVNDIRYPSYQGSSQSQGRVDQSEFNLQPATCEHARWLQLHRGPRWGIRLLVYSVTDCTSTERLPPHWGSCSPFQTQRGGSGACTDITHLHPKLTISLESQWRVVPNNILAEQKSYQIFSHEPNTFLCRRRNGKVILTNWHQLPLPQKLLSPWSTWAPI